MKLPSSFILVMDIPREERSPEEIAEQLDVRGFIDTDWEYSFDFWYIKDMEIMWLVEEVGVFESFLYSRLPQFSYSDIVGGKYDPSGKEDE